MTAIDSSDTLGNFIDVAGEPGGDILAMVKL
jgi:hypothetical protein